MQLVAEARQEEKKVYRSRFQRHVSILIWKSYLQRQRKWRLLLVETLFAGALFLSSIFIAKPVFLTPLQEEPAAPMSSSEILASLSRTSVLGYAPNYSPFSEVMDRVASTLEMNIMGAETEDDLDNMLYTMSKDKKIDDSVIWVIWKPKVDKMWQLSIRSTERARYVTSSKTSSPNQHLRAGFLAVQLAISQAIIEESSGEKPQYEINLVSMPVSPLMQERMVRVSLSRILFCFTFAFIPPVLETEVLVMHETESRLKRALRMRGVDFSAMYIGWLVYAYLTAIPISFLASVSLILIFRWIHLFMALLLMSAYVMVMIMMALIMAMFTTRVLIACLWSTLFTLLQTYLAELLIHHEYDEKHGGFTMLLHVMIPPLGLVNAFNQFALLQTGRGRVKDGIGGQSLTLTITSWILVIMVYFMFLMLLQRTLRQGGSAIGGQVSWKTIIFKTVEDENALHPIETPTGNERENLQEVDEHVAKAVSFRNVSKSIMGEQLLKNITLDIYRCEYTMLFCERIQDKMSTTIEDLLLGLTKPDKGSIYILGQNMRSGREFINEQCMVGYCHRSVMLIDDLTVLEHLLLFFDICLWTESRRYITEYSQIRLRRLMIDYDLEVVRHVRVRSLHHYYKAQLCWAIAMLIEPRVIIIPNFVDHPLYSAVIKNNIMTHQKYITIVKSCFASIQLEFADRVFVFDSKVVAFGGTPAYMFFKYGREYRLRMTLRSDVSDNETISILLHRSAAAGATVRAHLGKLLILRLPATPTNVVADLVSDLIKHADEYALTSLNITVADSEEVYNRTIYQSRQYNQQGEVETVVNNDTLRQIGTDQVPWKRQEVFWIGNSYLKDIGWKFFAFYVHYRLFFIITVITAILTGVAMGVSFSMMLKRSERDNAAKKLLHGDVLTIEAMVRDTVLMLRVDDSAAARSLAQAYVLSEPKATKEQVKHMKYSALPSSESLKEYLVTRAIDAPQLYVYLYAYGLDVNETNGKLNVQVLYSPLHYDQAAAARSMAKAYTALLRHYTSEFDASIQITDDPLALDLTPWMQYATKPPLLVQFLLLLSITHFTFIPSMERGLVCHMQKHAFNYSPARYWLTHYFCDVILYWILVFLMSASMMAVMYVEAPRGHFYYEDLFVIPVMLVVYGMVCVPQAYLFSYGPRVALNSMIFVIVNLVFGETTILAKIFFGDILSVVVIFMSLSPQYNMAYAYVKIKQTFLYNTECIIFAKQKLCSSRTLHKCCQKCGVLQDCFVRKTYLDPTSGVRTELIAMIVTSFIFTTTLLLIEHKVFRRFYRYSMTWVRRDLMSEEVDEVSSEGASRVKKDVLDKRKQMNNKQNETASTFGEYILAKNVSKKDMGVYTLHSIYLGLAKGDALAVAGLKRHGRVALCDILAGYTLPSDGSLFCMSKYRLGIQPHDYSRHISYCSSRDCLPSWMTVTDGLELLALLRGVPREYIKQEVKNYVEVLELSNVANVLICRISKNQRTRLNFAAAVVGAPPVIIADECTAYQKFSIRRVMYYILYHLRRRGHAIFISSSNVESHMPVTNRLAIMVDGTIFDIDSVDNLVGRYSKKGYTVVVHLKQEVVVEQVHTMFESYFTQFSINDTSEVLVNVQVLDPDLNWATIFERMETMKTENDIVYSYIISAIPIDYIYNYIISNERGRKKADDIISGFKFMKKSIQKRICPSQETLNNLKKPEPKFKITTLKELPWSVIFHR